MGLDDFPRPPTHRGGASRPDSSSQFQSRRHDRNYSPPSTPPSGGRKKQWSQPRALNTGLTYPETFLDDTTPIEPPGRVSESGDEQDPHDLALSPKHVTRTSVVDNMLLSLDQFSPGSPLFSDSRFFSNSPEPEPYIYSNNINNHRFSPSQHARFRSHTLSSSISSDVGPVSYSEDPLEYAHIPRSSGRRSNGSSSLQPSQRRYDTVRSRESVGSAYPARNYDVEEETTPPHVRSRYSVRQGSEDSTDSADYDDPAFEEPYIINSHRRSMSLDYGSRPAFLSNSSHDSELILNDLEAAPTPTVPPGPRRDLSSGLPGGLPHPRTPALSRRNSNKSARSTVTRKGRTETLGTSTIKYNADTPRPPLPPSFIDPSAPSPTISYQKPILPQVDLAPAKEKHGFFRRVFGSSKTSSEQSTPESTKVSTPKSDNIATPSQPRPENVHPVVSKKASSFFRRRKKSVVDSIPPPLILAPNTARALDMNAEPSPASSLRQVMNPYLSSEAPLSRKTTKDYAEDVSTQTRENDNRAVHLEPGQSFLEDSTPRSGGRQIRTADDSNKTTPRNKYGLDLQVISVNKINVPTINRNVDENAGSNKSAHRPQTSPLAPRGNLFTADPQSSVPEKKLHVNTSNNNLLPPLEVQSSNFVYSDPSPTFIQGSLKHERSSASNLSTSDASQYHTASNSPMLETPILVTKTPKLNQEESEDVSAEAADDVPSTADREIARRLFDDPEDVVGNEATAAWLGDIDREMVREAYMDLFNWTSMDILAALRSLCTKMALKGETQQVDRVLDALSNRWCECNSNHGFKAVGKFPLP
jgi:Sec7 domain